MKILSADEEYRGDDQDRSSTVPPPLTPPAPRTLRDLWEALRTRWEALSPVVRQRALIGTVASSGVLVAVWVLFFFFLNTKPVTVTVTGFSWNRQIEVEQFNPRREDGWSYPPGDAYDVDRDWRFHYTRQVFSHNESYSCGTYENPRTCSRAVYRTESVYDWYYTYTIDRWRTNRWLVTAALDQTPVWAEIPATFSTEAVYGNERVASGRRETYRVLTDHAELRILVSLPEFLARTIGETGTAAVNRVGSVRSVKWNVTNVTEVSLAVPDDRA